MHGIEAWMSKCGRLKNGCLSAGVESCGLSAGGGSLEVLEAWVSRSGSGCLGRGWKPGSLSKCRGWKPGCLSAGDGRMCLSKCRCKCMEAWVSKCKWRWKGCLSAGEEDLEV